jgi:hypothetical protein
MILQSYWNFRFKLTLSFLFKKNMLVMLTIIHFCGFLEFLLQNLLTTPMVRAFKTCSHKVLLLRCAQYQLCALWIWQSINRVGIKGACKLVM